MEPADRRRPVEGFEVGRSKVSRSGVDRERRNESAAGIHEPDGFGRLRLKGLEQDRELVQRILQPLAQFRGGRLDILLGQSGIVAIIFGE